MRDELYGLNYVFSDSGTNHEGITSVLKGFNTDGPTPSSRHLPVTMKMNRLTLCQLSISRLLHSCQQCIY